MTSPSWTWRSFLAESAQRSSRSRRIACRQARSSWHRSCSGNNVYRKFSMHRGYVTLCVETFFVSVRLVLIAPDIFWRSTLSDSFFLHHHGRQWCSEMELTRSRRWTVLWLGSACPVGLQWKMPAKSATLPSRASPIAMYFSARIVRRRQTRCRARWHYHVPRSGIALDDDHPGELPVGNITLNVMSHRWPKVLFQPGHRDPRHFFVMLGSQSILKCDDQTRNDFYANKNVLLGETRPCLPGMWRIMVETDSGSVKKLKCSIVYGFVTDWAQIMHQILAECVCHTLRSGRLRHGKVAILAKSTRRSSCSGHLLHSCSRRSICPPWNEDTGRERMTRIIHETCNVPTGVVGYAFLHTFFRFSLVVTAVQGAAVELAFAHSISLHTHTEGLGEVLVVSLLCSVSPWCLRSSLRCSASHPAWSATDVFLRRVLWKPQPYQCQIRHASWQLVLNGTVHPQTWSFSLAKTWGVVTKCPSLSGVACDRLHLSKIELALEENSVQALKVAGLWCTSLHTHWEWRNSPESWEIVSSHISWSNSVAIHPKLPTFF